MPVFLMALGPMLTVVRQMRSGVLEVLGQTYVRTARAKGLAERRVISRHIIKNAFTPVATATGLIVAGLVTGVAFVELVFAIPGFGFYTLSGFQGRDFPVIMAGAVIGSTLTVSANLIVDLIYVALDPRVRLD